MSTETPAPVELFGHLWDPTDNPDGHTLAVEHLAAHALDVDTAEVEAA